MRHHPVILLAVTVLLGLTLAEAAVFFPAAVTVLLAGMGLLGWRRGAPGHLLYAALLLAVLYGQYRHWHVPPDDVGHFAGRTVRLTAQVAELPHVEPGRAEFVARARSVAVGGRTVTASGRVRVNHYLRRGETPLAYGDLFSVEVALKPITSLGNPGGFDYAAFMWRQGVRVRASIGHAAAVARLGNAAPPPARWVNRWRLHMRQAIKRALPPESAGLLAALAIGDGRGIPEEVRERFQAAGVAHLLAISGTHLGLVAGLAFLLARWGLACLPYALLRRLTNRITLRQAAGVTALLAVTGYALLSGGRTPTLRALVMVWMVMLALLSGRTSHGVTALALAALAILLVDPVSLGEASFQLSFAAVLAILLVVPRLTPPAQAPPSAGERIRRWAVATGAVTVVAGLATAPLVAWHFGQVTWPGFLSNLVLVPVMGTVVLPLAVGAAVAAPLSGGLPLAGAVAWLLARFLDAVGSFAALPGALTRVPTPPLALVGLTYAVALTALWGREHLDRRTAVTGAAVFLLAWGAALHPGPPTGQLRVAVLDVAQGDAAVVTGPDGTTLVIDGGTRMGRFDLGRLAVSPYLTHHGIGRVTLLASHVQMDHAGGLIYLARTFRPDTLFTNGEARPQARFARDLHRAMARAGTAETVLARGRPFHPLPGVRTQVLNPGAEGSPFSDGNDRSLVVRLRYGRHSFLFPGDIEAPAESLLTASGADLSATVLKVPHHGSATSSTEAFLARVAPRLAVVSAGADNPYGHPSPAVIRRYRERGVRLRQTVRDGAVLMASDGVTLRMATWRDLAPARIPPWHPAPLAEEWKNAVRLLLPGRLWRTVA